MIGKNKPKLHTRPGASTYMNNEWGIPISIKSLETFATRGGGPLMRKFGRRVFYEADDLDDWCISRLSAPLESTSSPIWLPPKREVTYSEREEELIRSARAITRRELDRRRRESSSIELD